MLSFRSEADIDLWCERRRLARGAVMDLELIWQLAQIWYLLGERDLEGRGVVTDAVGQVCRLAFEKLGLESLYAWLMAPNEASRRVLEKNRFREAGRLRR